MGMTEQDLFYLLVREEEQDKQQKGGKPKGKESDSSEYEQFIQQCINRKHEKNALEECESEWKRKKARDNIEEGNIEDGQVFMLSSKFCSGCNELLSENYIKSEVDKGNIIVLEDEDPLKETIAKELDIKAEPEFAVYLKDRGFVTKEEAKRIELEEAGLT